ncbi:MAG: DUF2304 family protein [Candidatus Beckwithbacteria bacterium]|nr:DUF2304 family protein [Patescibacteria group bacterium]
MNLLPIQIVLSIFLVFAATRVILRLKDGALTIKSFSFWFTVFVLAIIGVIKPELTTLIAQKLGIGRGTDAVIYASILLLFYLIFRTNVMLENQRHDLTKLIRDLALKDESKSKK